jgi:hypothetical protein
LRAVPRSAVFLQQLMHEEPTMSELGLADAIAQLRREISTAAQAAEGEALQFTLGPVELELQIELVNAASAKADFKWVVVSAGGEARGERTRTHKVNLTLTPQIDGAPVLVNDTRSAPPK